MPKITVQGLEDYERFLNNLGIEVEEVIIEGVHRGAGEIANEVRNQMRAIPTDEKWGTPNNPARGIKKIQKRGLFEGFGISPERNDRGFINVKIGFEGYNDAKSKRWPKGQPNVMIARTLEKGTSFLIKYPFLKKAVNQSKRRAVEAAQAAIDEKIEELKRRT